jgi:uncharacterized protein YndB with AHSA1/START domain
MTQTDKLELTIERIFDASRERVWKAWTTPEGVMQWWGPRQFTCPESKIDFRVGGRYVFCMRAPDGKDSWSGGTYEEIVPLEKIVATDSFTDKEGNVVSPAEYGMDPGFPEKMRVIVTFEDMDGKTKMTLRHGDISTFSEKDRTNMEQGWNESLDKLAESLA